MGVRVPLLAQAQNHWCFRRLIVQGFGLSETREFRLQQPKLRRLKGNRPSRARGKSRACAGRIVAQDG
jgi:hypothetical protein